MKATSLKLIKNFSYTLTSNLLSLVVSAFVALIVPRFIGVSDYGYFQLYVFYSSYSGLMHFGWNDGIYLRYGGSKYNELDNRLFFSQFYMLLMHQIVIAAIICVMAFLVTKDAERIFVFSMVAFNIVILNMLNMLLFIMQATNRIKEYAKSTLLMKAAYFVLVVITIMGGIIDYKIVVVSDLIGKLLALLYAVYCCRSIVLNRFSMFFLSINEAKASMSVGAKLMFANIAGMLIIGVVRFGIERVWDVETFGQVSLTLNISKMIMLFINSIAIVMFPVLRRTEENRLPEIYLTLRDFLMIVLLGILLLHYPAKIVLSVWLPHYSASLDYLALLFPMSVFEGKMAMLINTYLKTLRKEKLMLRINVISLSFSVIITIITTLVLKDLSLAIASIVILLAFRCVLAEYLISKILNVEVYRDIYLELGMTVVFITTAWFMEDRLGGSLYLIAFVAYLVAKHKEIADTTQRLRGMIGA